jgi:glycosyltransferase involved in cell wall biosynthesis
MFSTNEFPVVSIILPTYNRANYILETIDSVQKQTYQHWELIIVDDGSDDNTEEIITEIKDERIQFCKAGRIGINGKVKNIGLEKAAGELIAFIDSDDLWAPTKLEKQVAIMQQYPEAGFSLTGGYNFRKLHEPVAYFYKETGGIRYDNIFVPIFKSEVAGLTPTLMLRAQCIGITGSFKESKSFSDADFILNLAYHYKAVILYEPLFFRRLHDRNDSTKEWEAGYEKGIAMVKTYKKVLPPGIAAKVLLNLHINSGEKYLSAGKMKKAIHHFFKAWASNPLSIVPLRKIAKTGLSIFKK